MPRRMAITGPYKIEILEYTDPPLGPNDVLVRTEIASGKHGTTTAMFDGATFRGQTFDQDMRLFVEKQPEPEPEKTAEKKPSSSGTSGVGTVVDMGSGVTRWKKGDRVLTSGGLFATILNVKEDRVVATIADGIKVEISKSSISGVIEKG